MEKSTISMVIFHSCVNLPEGTWEEPYGNLHGICVIDKNRSPKNRGNSRNPNPLDTWKAPFFLSERTGGCCFIKIVSCPIEIVSVPIKNSELSVSIICWFSIVFPSTMIFFHRFHGIKPRFSDQVKSEPERRNARLRVEQRVHLRIHQRIKAGRRDGLGAAWEFGKANLEVPPVDVKYWLVGIEMVWNVTECSRFLDF